MTNNSPATDFPFTGYRYHRKSVDLAKLWQSFIHRTAEQIDHEAKVYVSGQYSKVDAGRIEREAEKQLYELEKNY